MVDIRGLLATSDDDGGGISSSSQLEKGRGGSSSGKASEKGTGNISKPKRGWFGKRRKHCGPYDRPPWNPLAVPDDSLLLDADIDEQVYWEEPGERPDQVWLFFGKRKMPMTRKAKRPKEQRRPKEQPGDDGLSKQSAPPAAQTPSAIE